MTIVFRYKTVTRPDGTPVKTPSIPIFLIGKETFETTGLLDSGADISVISKDIADLLGLDLSGETHPAYGIGGKVDSIESKVSITLEKGHEHYEISLPIKVILGQYDFPFLLGRIGFFDNFVISFDQSNEKVSLKKTIKSKA